MLDVISSCSLVEMQILFALFESLTGFLQDFGALRIR